jgi:hypothetical protein
MGEIDAANPVTLTDDLRVLEIVKREALETSRCYGSLPSPRGRVLCCGECQDQFSSAEKAAGKVGSSELL